MKPCLPVENPLLFLSSPFRIATHFLRFAQLQKISAHGVKRADIFICFLRNGNRFLFVLRLIYGDGVVPCV